jgi:ribosome-associated protein
VVSVPGDLRIRGSVVIPVRELRWRFSRSSGPGGQSVNTAVAHSSALGPRRRARALERLADRLVDGVLTVTAAEHRSQLRNREAAEQRLAAILDAALAPPPPPRRPTKPSRAARARRVEQKRLRSQTKRLRRPPPD